MTSRYKHYCIRYLESQVWTAPAFPLLTSLIPSSRSSVIVPLLVFIFVFVFIMFTLVVLVIIRRYCQTPPTATYCLMTYLGHPIFVLH